MCSAGDTTFSMHKVLHCPKASFNLLFVKRFACDNCCVFQFDDDGFLIKDKISGKTLYQSHAEGDMYPISFTAPASSSPRVCISKKHSTKLWHHRLGHPSSNILSTILHQLQLPSSSLESLCSSWSAREELQTSFHFNSTFNHWCSSTPALWGPSPVLSSAGFKYYVLLIDDFTRFSWLFPIKLKSDFYHVFENFCTLVENQFNTFVKILRTNGGGEFSTKLLAKFLQTKGILHQKSCSYTPEQNGVVERKHRHLVETGLTLLVQSKLPLSLWLEAFTTVVFLINRMPIVANGSISPFQLMFNKPPDYFIFRPFGCRCFPWLRPYNSNKLQFRSIECIFLGYCQNKKGYKCWHPFIDKVYAYRNVRFMRISFLIFQLPFHLQVLLICSSCRQPLGSFLVLLLSPTAYLLILLHPLCLLILVCLVPPLHHPLYLLTYLKISLSP